jgi:hypothetical protein
VPLRLRSNVAYTLKMSAAAMTYGSGTPDANSVTLADIGFGVLSSARDSGGGVMAGTDTIAATAVATRPPGRRARSIRPPGVTSTTQAIHWAITPAARPS